MERINNMFKFATKELSQDAFLCWLVNYINTDEEYMLTMAHLNEEKYTSLSRKYRNNIKSIKYIPRSLSTPFPIFLSESEWKKESKYNDLENNYELAKEEIDTAIALNANPIWMSAGCLLAIGILLLIVKYLIEQKKKEVAQ